MNPRDGQRDNNYQASAIFQNSDRTLHFLISRYWSYFIAPKNIRKPEVFLMFSGGMERDSYMKWIKPCNPWYYACSLMLSLSLTLNIFPTFFSISVVEFHFFLRQHSAN